MKVESARPAQLLFEHLEPRLLLSADPSGLAGQISPDFLDDQGASEAAIVVDFEAVANDEWLVESEEEIPDHGSQITEASPNAEDRRPNTEVFPNTEHRVAKTDATGSIAANAQISVADGTSTGTLAVLVTDDPDVEGTETVDAQISNSSNGDVTINTALASANISDNDSATAVLSVTTQGDETGPVDIVYTVTLSKTNNTGTTITFDLDDLGTGTATSGSDYTAVAANAQISVANGATTGTLTVPVTDDTVLEATETVIAQISNPSIPAVTIGTASATANISDNEIATLLVSLDGNDLKNEDTGGVADEVTLVRDQVNSRWIISDSANFIDSTVPNTFVLSPTSVAVPFAEVSGSAITVDLNAGADSLTLDFSDSSFSKAITYNGGDPTSGSGDSLTLTGGTFDNATYNFTNANDGTIDITGNSTITYTGLEQITSTITATDVTLNYSTTAETDYAHRRNRRQDHSGLHSR